MRQVVALLGVAALVVTLLAACGGGGGDSEQVGAEKAACNNAPDFSLRSPSHAPASVAYRPAALPPEPVGELLPKAKFVVEANVARVLYQGDTPDRANHKKNLAGPIPPARCQVVRFDITHVVSGGDPGSSLTVVKPLAPYVLKVGQATAGEAFLVQGGDPFPIILGRYGPYPIGDVEAALSTGQ
jgi:hypothetical protein